MIETALHELTVERGRVTHEAIQLPSGVMLAVELARPREAFIILHRSGDQIEVLASCASEAEAVERCRLLRRELAEMAGPSAGRKDVLH